MVVTSSSDPDKILAKAMMHLIETAAKDGIITEEEVELIDTFEVSLKKYERALRLAFEDGVIDEREEKLLEDIKDKIIKNGTEVAGIDGISKDEMNLLISMMLSLEIPRPPKD